MVLNLIDMPILLRFYESNIDLSSSESHHHAKGHETHTKKKRKTIMSIK